MLACLRVFSAALLVVASLTAPIAPALAESVPSVTSACGGAGHAHGRAVTPSVHGGPASCGQCGHGCGPGQCVAPATLAAAGAAPAGAPQRPERTGYDVACDPLRSTSATPPMPPPQPDL